MNVNLEDQIFTQSNELGVAFTSSSPFVGYHYRTQPNLPPSTDTIIPSSILAQAMPLEPSTPLSRAASSGTPPSISTGVASNSVSEPDTLMASTSGHTLRRATYDGVTYPISSLSPFTDPPVTLLVGGPASPSKETEPIPFYIHKNVLTAISPFFRAAFEMKPQATFSEGTSRTMKLPEDRPGDFAYLLQWVYWQLSNTPCNASAHGQYSHHVSLNAPDNSALSLWHPSIDIPLSRYQAYKATKKADKTLAGVVEKQPRPSAFFTTVNAVDWHFGLAMEPHTQQPLTQLSAQPTIEPEAVKENTLNTCHPTHPTIPRQKRLVRPLPPAFGPLIRLYVLADKYALPTSLKQDICKRVREVGREGKCVPDADDVAMLWEDVLGDAGEGHAHQCIGGESGVERMGLKDTVLEMYDALSTKSFRGLFFPSPATSSLAEELESESAVQRRPRDDVDEAYRWHPVFMRDLLARKFEGDSAATTAVVSHGREVVSGRDGTLESFGELGLVRRRARFPSLCGVSNRSGEEVLGGSP